ncbi:hypothetical protein PVAND_015049 [Polypedilum vanderplanki]|uniref:Integrase catalytic domain-containing protein n=1 Tax=Polypedilum vanderplanki TaxID=319348 RepID=A0A9J6BBV8_POLVA|nr:hypothetical protein PVAND_015049 [Polypedilum vanderplanki]
MADLSQERINKSNPFQHVGIDCAGPTNMKFLELRRAKDLKVWVVVFVCMLTRVVHLELNNSLDIEHFLQAFDRFCVRRNTPDTIISDNGRNFNGANRIMMQNWLKIRQSTMTSKRIRWKFIPRYSASFGANVLRKITILSLPNEKSYIDAIDTKFVQHFAASNNYSYQDWHNLVYDNYAWKFWPIGHCINLALKLSTEKSDHYCHINDLDHQMTPTKHEITHVCHNISKVFKSALIEFPKIENCSILENSKIIAGNWHYTLYNLKEKPIADESSNETIEPATLTFIRLELSDLNDSYLFKPSDHPIKFGSLVTVVSIALIVAGAFLLYKSKMRPRVNDLFPNYVGPMMAISPLAIPNRA